MIIPTKRNKLKEVLMNPKAVGVKEPYFYIKGEESKNITIVSPGKNGDEFNKTYGHFHSYPEVEIYQCVYGQGVMVMQRNDYTSEAKEFKVVTLRPGTMVEVPSGFGHCIVNVGKTYLVVLDNAYKQILDKDLRPIREKRGLSYYVVDKKGDVGFVPNPNYILHPQITLA